MFGLMLAHVVGQRSCRLALLSMAICRSFDRVDKVVKARRSRWFDEVVDFSEALFSAFACSGVRRNRNGVRANCGARMKFAQIVLFFDVCQSRLFGLLLMREIGKKKIVISVTSSISQVRWSRLL